MSAVWEMENLAPSAKLVLLALCDFANDRGESCFPSIKTIAEKSSLSERQAQRLMHRLINSGAISVLKNEKGGKAGSTRHYRIHINRLTTGDILTPVIDETGDMDVVGRVTSAPKTGDMGVTLTTKEPSTKPASRKEEICREEVLPPHWQDIAEQRGIPNEQIFKSWRKFKDTTSQPCRLSRWQAWVSRETVR